MKSKKSLFFSPKEIDFSSMYCALESKAMKKRRKYLDLTEFYFTEGQIKEILVSQGITNEDVPEAIEYALEKGMLSKSKRGREMGYKATDIGVAVYIKLPQMA